MDAKQDTATLSLVEVEPFAGEPDTFLAPPQPPRPPAALPGPFSFFHDGPAVPAT